MGPTLPPFAAVVGQILYGAEKSALFGPTLLVGGMTVSPDLFVQSGVNMTQVDQASKGNWRILSKVSYYHLRTQYVPSPRLWGLVP